MEVNKKIFRKSNDLHAKISGLRHFRNKDILNEIKEFYRVSVVYSSNSLEGCTYTESETELLIRDGIISSERPVSDSVMVLRLNQMYDKMFDLVKDTALDVDSIFQMHKLLDGALVSNAVAGECRSGNIFVSGSSRRFPDLMRAFSMLTTLS